MAEPSWRQLAAIPESLIKRNVLHAVGITPPPAGIGNCCDLGDIVLHFGEAGLIVEDRASKVTRYMDAREVLRVFKLSRGIPSGELARWWLKAKGLLPAVAS